MELVWERVQAYRAATYRLTRRVTTLEEAVAFVKERGFVYFWPIQGVTLPSLWVAVAGDRPVPNEHDDPGHITWGWKDALLGQRRWYYAKVLRKKATLIALNLVPFFYALSENYGDYTTDYLEQYQQGRMTQEAKAIYEALLREGPLHTLALREAAHLTSAESEYRFNRALETLQADFKLLPVGIAEAGAWRYAFIYDLVARHYPELPEQARSIGLGEARQRLAASYFQSVGAAPVREVLKLFGWSAAEAEAALTGLVQAGRLCRGLLVAGRREEWVALPEIAFH